MEYTNQKLSPSHISCWKDVLKYYSRIKEVKLLIRAFDKSDFDITGRLGEVKDAKRILLKTKSDEKGLVFYEKEQKWIKIDKATDGLVSEIFKDLFSKKKKLSVHDYLVSKTLPWYQVRLNNYFKKIISFDPLRPETFNIEKKTKDHLGYITLLISAHQLARRRAKLLINHSNQLKNIGHLFALKKNEYVFPDWCKKDLESLGASIEYKKEKSRALFDIVEGMISSLKEEFPSDYIALNRMNKTNLEIYGYTSRRAEL